MSTKMAMELFPSKGPEVWLCVALICLMLAQLGLVKSAQTDNYDQDSPGRQLLAGPDFRLTARAWMLRTGSLTMLSDEIITEEFYSNSQRRATIQLHQVDEEDREQVTLHSEYHYHEGQVIQNPTYSSKVSCGPISADRLVRDLFGKMALTEDWLKVRAAVPDYVVGMARLLFIVDYHRNSLLASSETESVIVRNHKTISYQMPAEAEAEFGLGKRLKIYYAETRDHYGGFDLPIRIQFRDKNNGFLMIDFSLVGPMQDDIVEQVDNMYPLDAFAVPIGIGCSEKMAPVSKGGWRTVPVQVASFQAEIFKHNRLGTKQSSLSRRFVAYDAYAGAMRSDAINSVSYSATIVDLWNKLKYNLLFENGLGGKTISQRQCVTSKVADPEKYRAFLPFKEFVFMGKALIRGVECFAFEQPNSELPPVLFPLMTYINLEGKEESIFGRDSQTYTIVYYFAITSAETPPQPQTNKPLRDVASGPLMRIDVYLKKVLQYQMDIFDYMNQLVGAPNGDRQEELFALKDRCTSGQLGTDGYASLALEFTYRPATSSKPKSTQEVMETLASSHLRNKATLRALARGSVGIVSKISDLETQIRLSSSDELKIYVEARLNLPDIEVSEVLQVGWSSLTFAPSEVKTIEECFQWAAHAQLDSTPVLFVSCANSCMIDLRASVEFEPNGRAVKSVTSNIYKPDPKRSLSSSCPAMLIQTNGRGRQYEGKLDAMRTTFNWIRSDYEGKLLRLLMPNEGLYDVSRDDMVFEVTKVDINNDKWSVALGYEKAHLNDNNDTLFRLPARGFAASIDGLGLSESNGQLQRPKQKESSPDEEPIMNYQVCHSICMAKMGCRSFSVCVTRQGIECIISEVDFRDQELLREIEEKLSSERQFKEDPDSIKIRTFTVANPKRAKRQDAGQAADLEDPAANYEQIELRFDFRCKLYKKNALEMFHKLRPTTVALKNSALSPVGSQEQCAEICLKNNMVFFKRMAQTKLELMRNNEQELEDEELINRIRDEYNTNLMSWCSTFYFLSSSSPDLDKQARSFVDAEKLASAGLCVIARSPDRKKVPGKAKKKNNDKNKQGEESLDEQAKPKERVGPRIVFESFQFLYSNLFDIQFGIRMEEAETDDQGKPLPMINRSLREYTLDAESCARRCFLQMSDLSPMCKSFDFIETRSRVADSKYGRTIVNRYCEFHTLSLSEVRLNGMVEFVVADMSANDSDPAGPVEQYWHYDSRDSYTLEDALMTELVLVKSEATLLDSIQAYRLHAPAIMAIVMAALLLSAAIVVLHGDNFANRCNIARRDSISDPPRSFLSSLVSGQSAAGLASPGSGGSSSSSIKHKRFVASDLDLPDIPELSAI